jgi:2-dehydro-3-deoxyphosphogluconate aldolase/(4S)-4-hydroxy-2-oxoglutarate aldolase
MSPAFDSQLAGRIQSSGIVAVLVIDRAEDAVPLGRALLAGGIDAIELTLRTPAALDALREIRQSVPELLAGVGTILSPEQVAQVVEAGAAFGVAPGTNPRVLAAAREAGLSFAPGIATPTDIEIFPRRTLGRPVLSQGNRRALRPFRNQIHPAGRRE